MKGIKLAILAALAVIAGMIIGLTIFTDTQSWSEAAKFKSSRWALTALLSSIIVVLMSIGSKHKDRNKEILKNWKLPNLKTLKFKKPFIKLHKKNIDLRQLAYWSAAFFAGVIIFDLGGGAFSKMMHYIVTGLGAFSVYLMVTRMLEKGYIKTIYIVGFMVATVIWLIGLLSKWFKFDMFTVFDGENAFIIVAVVWIVSQIKNIED